MIYKDNEEIQKKNFTELNEDSTSENEEEYRCLEEVLSSLFEETDPIAQHHFIEQIDEILNEEDRLIPYNFLIESHLCDFILDTLANTSSLIALPYFHILDILSKNADLQEIMISHDIIFVLNQFLSDSSIDAELAKCITSIYINIIYKIVENNLLYHISFELISKSGADIAALTFFEVLSSINEAAKISDQIILYSLYSSPVDEETSNVFANIAFSCVYNKPENFRLICCHPDIEHSNNNLFQQILKYVDDDNVSLVTKVMKLIIYGYSVKSPYIIQEMKDRAAWVFDIALSVEEENASYYSLMAFASMASIDNESVQSLATPDSISRLLKVGSSASFKNCVSIGHTLYALLFNANEECAIEAIENGIFEFAAAYYDVDDEWTENMAHLIRVILRPLRETSVWNRAIEKLEESSFFDNIDRESLSEKTESVVDAVFNWIYPGNEEN